MICYICNSEKIRIKHKGVRDNPNINVKECQSCGLVSLDSFLHISDSFYEDSKMYTFPISIDELSKMERDMIENKICYGIFISLQTNLVGFKTIDFHAFKDKNGKEYFVFIIGKMIDNISLIDIGIKFINSLKFINSD